MPAPRPKPASPPPAPARDRAAGFLAGLRIRKKLIFLHTVFSLTLGAILVIALRPAVERVVEQAEVHEARIAALLLASRLETARARGEPPAAALAGLRALLPGDVDLRSGDPAAVGLSVGAAEAARAAPGSPVLVELAAGRGAVLHDPAGGVYHVARVRLEEARAGVTRLFLLLTGALLAVYAMIAAALEVFVLPRHVYRPIREILAADHAARAGGADAAPREGELIPDREIPADELGEIMRSRNDTIRSLRRHEHELAAALKRLEEAATDLKRKNHLLETAQRNLADADRLASLGMMSAGLAHEMNTPLAVIKGLAERMQGSGRLEPPDAALLLRVTGRLERLSESLLDFARAREPATEPTRLRPLVDEASTLVRLDRAMQGRFELVNDVDDALVIRCDPDRLLQVFVNLIRNAADAMADAPRAGLPAPPGAPPPPAVFPPGPAVPRRVTVSAETTQRHGRSWVSISVADEGPGLNPAIVGRLFEPFASTRLDSRGTGLGLAVSEGIVKEHGGLLLARNRTEGTGAVFEILLPRD